MAINQLSSANHGLTGLSAPTKNRNDVAAVQPVGAKSETAATDHVSEAEVKRSLEAINRFLQPANGDIQFIQDDETGKTLVKIVDTKTQTVLRQIPTKEAVAIAKELDRVQGLLVREKA
jgi:flagellar protein FlaG